MSRKKERPNLQDEHLYILCTKRKDGSPGPLKVGISRDAFKRLEQIKTACPYEVTMGGIFAMGNRDASLWLERGFHHINKDKRLNGEWFEMDLEEALTCVGQGIATLLREQHGHGPEFDEGVRYWGLDKLKGVVYQAAHRDKMQ